jgi:pyruvate dehydrogenase E2 component (dihydrolipoamide acetyltransferase)
MDIGQVKGTGPSGRISIEDVKSAARARVAPQPGTAPSVPTPGLPDFTRWGEVHREPFTSIRRATARQVSAAWSTIPHVTQFDRADVTELDEMRARYADKAQQAGGKLTVTAILLKVVASALRVFPKFNASLDMEKGEIVYKQYFHVGVAVDTPKGLLVPVIRDVERKNVVELSVELTSISEKARSGKLTLEEMQGGSFTVSNLGGIGGTGFAPIVNLPEVAILGVSRTSIEPVFIDGSFQPRKMLPLSLSYDHRLIDGADGARFLRWVAEALEQPFLMLLEG